MALTPVNFQNFNFCPVKAKLPPPKPTFSNSVIAVVSGLSVIAVAMLAISSIGFLATSISEFEPIIQLGLPIHATFMVASIALLILTTSIMNQHHKLCKKAEVRKAEILQENYNYAASRISKHPSIDQLKYGVLNDPNFVPILILPLIDIVFSYLEKRDLDAYPLWELQNTQITSSLLRSKFSDDPFSIFPEVICGMVFHYLEPHDLDKYRTLGEIWEKRVDTVLDNFDLRELPPNISVFHKEDWQPHASEFGLDLSNVPDLNKRIILPQLYRICSSLRIRDEGGVTLLLIPKGFNTRSLDLMHEKVAAPHHREQFEEIRNSYMVVITNEEIEISRNYDYHAMNAHLGSLGYVIPPYWQTLVHAKAMVLDKKKRLESVERRRDISSGYQASRSNLTLPLESQHHLPWVRLPGT